MTSPFAIDVEDTSTFTWTSQRERAAIMVAEDEQTDAQIAEAIGVSTATLGRWKRDTTFAGRVADTVGELRVTALKFAIAKRHKRIAKLQDIVDRIEQTIEARAARAAADPEAPAEAHFGILSERRIMVAGGHTASSWETDDKLLREYRAALEQAAKDLGQLTERVEVQQESIIRRYVGVDVDAV